MSADIVKFIKDRLEEWRQAAVAAGDEAGETWLAFPNGEVIGGDPGLAVSSSVAGAKSGMEGEHIALHDPASVLRQAGAIEAIVALCEQPPVDVTAAADPEPHYVLGAGAPWGEPVLRHLAAMWSTHPDYDPSWRMEP